MISPSVRLGCRGGRGGGERGKGNREGSGDWADLWPASGKGNGVARIES